jgi:hypothetical protein
MEYNTAVDVREKRIESETDFDVLYHDNFTMDVIDRFGDDGETQTINVYGKSTIEIIRAINSL